jgi:hypothetical protein
MSPALLLGREVNLSAPFVAVEIDWYRLHVIFNEAERGEVASVVRESSV